MNRWYGVVIDGDLALDALWRDFGCLPIVTAGKAPILPVKLDLAPEASTLDMVYNVSPLKGAETWCTMSDFTV